MESVFGRDAASVFPNMKAGDDPLEALKASMGAKRFVTESEVRCCCELAVQQRNLTARTTPTPHAHTTAGGDEGGARPQR